MTATKNAEILPSDGNGAAPQVTATPPGANGRAFDIDLALTAVTRLARSGYWVWDHESASGLYASHEAAETFGLSQQEFLSARRDLVGLLDRIHADDRAAYASAWKKSNAGQPTSVDFRPLDGGDDGRARRYRETSEPVTAKDGRLLQTIGVVQEITELWQIRTELGKYEDLIQRTQRMESLGTLAGGLAHDFANVLQPIIMATEDATDLLPPDHPAQHNLQQALAAAERASDLVRRVLQFSRGEAPSAGSFDIRNVIAEAVELVRRTLPSSIHFREDLEPGVGECCLTPAEATQIVINLVVNAADAMQGKGSIAIRLRRQRADTVCGMRGIALPPGDYARLTVQDDGTGMTPQVAERVFEPLFTTKEPGQGTGLGLAVVHGLIVQRGGTLLLETAPGEGARFDIFLPLVAQSPDGEGEG